nr:Chain C, Nucleoprotein [Severe acute respiratory syndrome coronavirus 2]
LQLPQGTTL